MVLNAFLRFRLMHTKPGGSLPSIHSNYHHPSESASRKRQGRYLLTRSELPPWVDANPYVLSGYRPESQSFWISLESWTYLHNESCNIYSHLIPGICLLFGQGVLYQHVKSKNELSRFDWGILSLQLLTASICLLVSAFYHTLSNHSELAAHRWLQFDYVGILTLILGNFISGLHFGFYCEPDLKYFYWGLIMTLSLITAIALLSPKFRGPRFRTFRLASFICTGLSAIAPIGHVWLSHGASKLEHMGVPYYCLEGMLLFIGCYFWERRLPERLFPGKFDIWLHSHTIWHVFVAASIGAHVCGLLSAVDYTYESAWCRFR